VNKKNKQLDDKANEVCGSRLAKKGKECGLGPMRIVLVSSSLKKKKKHKFK
jgi:hypothetical protein